jgi:malonyl-CoA O-methyltransferase
VARPLKISQAFSRAAASYDQQAIVQNFVAQRLASKILAQKGTSLGAILEVGCGTGTLTPHLLPHCSQYVLSDFSHAILKIAMEKTQDERVMPIVLNAEHPCFAASFDVIVSNLALHWFQDPKGALTRLTACLKPGGWLYLTALGNNTFHEWRAAHALVDAPSGVLDFIPFGQLKNWLPLSGNRAVEEEWMTTTPSNALEFLRGLKQLGGYLPQAGHRPLPYSTFKKVMEIYNVRPQTSYQILFASYQKPQKMREE